MTSPTLLLCDINRQEKGRLLIAPAEIHEIFAIINEIHTYNQKVCSNDFDRAYLNKNPTTIKIALSDGATYQLKDAEDALAIKTSQDRQITNIEIKTQGGEIQASVFLGYRFSSSSSISLHGPEDKVENYARRLERIIRGNSDYTQIAKRISSYWLGVLLSTFVMAWTLYGISFVEAKLDIKLLGPIVLFSWLGLIFWLAVFLDGLQEKWLPSVSFLWGYGKRQHEIARTALKVAFFTFPAWVATSFAIPILLGPAQSPHLATPQPNHQTPNIKSPNQRISERLSN